MRSFTNRSRVLLGVGSGCAAVRSACCLIDTGRFGLLAAHLSPERSAGGVCDAHNVLRINGVVLFLGRSHGFRSSFQDWASECTDHPREVIEAALAHVVRNQTEAAYARADLFERRRRLMDDWMGFLDRRRRQEKIALVTG